MQVTAESSSPMPDRKISVGGISGLITLGLMYAIRQVWPEATAEISQLVDGLVSLIVGYAVSYWIPPTLGDLLRRVDGLIADLKANPRTDSSQVEEAKTALYQEIAKAVPPSERPTEVTKALK